jgi:hypothetical protein
MCQVRIIEMRRTCRVICACGFDRLMVFAPVRCPHCGAAWDRPEIEEAANA